MQIRAELISMVEKNVAMVWIRCIYGPINKGDIFSKMAKVGEQGEVAGPYEDISYSLLKIILWGQEIETLPTGYTATLWIAVNGLEKIPPFDGPQAVYLFVKSAEDRC